MTLKYKSYGIRRARLRAIVLFAVICAGVFTAQARRSLINDVSQLYANASYNDGTHPDDGGGLDALIDGNADTYWHADYASDRPMNIDYCVEARNLGRLKSGQKLQFYFQHRNFTNDHPYEFIVYLHKAGTDFSDANYVNAGNIILANHTAAAVNTIDFTIPAMPKDSEVDGVRFVIYKYCHDNGEPAVDRQHWFHLAELQIYTKEILVSPAQLYTNCPVTVVGNGDRTPLSNLIDGLAGSYWHSDYSYDGHVAVAADKYYIEVNNFGINAPGDVYFFFQQREIGGHHVTKFQVEVHEYGHSDDDFTVVGNVAVAAGSNAISRARINIPYKYDKMRLVVAAVDGTDVSNNTFFHLAELQVSSEPFPETMTVHGHGEPVNMRDFTGPNVTIDPEWDRYTFTHTQGIADPANRFMHVDGFDNYMNLTDADWEKIRNNQWETAQASGLTMPDFTYINASKDSRIKTGVRQPTHVTEHTVYALPGYTCILKPYSDFATQSNYYVQMSRWYDYTTDATSPNLYYVDNPTRIRRTHYGDLVGRAIWDIDANYSNMPAFWTDDQNFEDVVIAVDSYQQWDPEHNLSGGELKEPIVSFRHIFTVKNGVRFAQEVSSSVEANRAYVKANKRIINARAGVQFQVRLLKNLPKDMGGSMDFFYLDNNNTPQRVYHPYIKATDSKGAETDIFSLSHDYTSRGGLFQTADKSAVYELGEYNEPFVRFITCEAANAKAGTYTVQIIARDKNDKTVCIKGTGEPLVLVEYEITFMPEQTAIFVREDDLTQPKYSHTLNSYISSADGLNLGAPKAKVDFDEYAPLIGNPKYTHQDGEGHRLIWPFVWDKSNYSFGYSYYNDYNMYVLATNTASVPYNGQTMNVPANENFNAGLSHRQDRLFYETQGKQHGFMYYVNASTDPGTMATMNIDDLCSGSTLFVTGWACECSGGETANLILNFAAVKHNGEKVVLHSFTTGYIENNDAYLGKWHYFYYSFVPNFDALGLSSGDIDHYVLSLENNCKGSGGADYMVDDIRVYVAKPRMQAKQTMPICAGGTSTTVRVHTPYEVIMATMGEVPDRAEAKDVTFYYTFLKKTDFDSKLKEYDGQSDAYERAFNESVLKYEYNSGEGEKWFGHTTFNTVYDKNPEFTNDDWGKPTSTVSRMVIDGERCLVFNTLPTDKDLVIGGEYYMALYTDVAGTGNITPLSFDVTGECAKVCSFIIHSSGVVKIDGVPVPDMTNIQVCENQWPMVQLDIYGRDSSGNIPKDTPLGKNVYLDWFDGSMSVYNSTTYTSPNGLGHISLAAAVKQFRDVKDYLEEEDPTVPAKEQYTALARECLIYFSTTYSEAAGQRRPPLHLHKASYVFPYLTVPDGMDKFVVYCTAIPINRYKQQETATFLICTDPSEIRVVVANKSPFLKHGINSTTIPYPSTMDDVPLRISLDMLNQVSGNIEADLADNTQLLGVPLRWTEAATPGVTRLLQKTNDDYLYLVETNDPAYQNLSVPTDNPSGMRQIGRLRQLTAIVEGDKASNNALMQFRDDFIFREGYYYRVRFDYQEDKYNSSQTICDGQDVLTIKVVPEFQKWTGANGNANFNNDGNWSRVSAADMFREDNAADVHTYAEGSDPENVPSGSTSHRNNTRRSYAPVHFVKAIDCLNDHEITLNQPKATYISYTDFISGSPVTKNWTVDESADATPDIEYDMVAEKHTANAARVVCRPWQANTCHSIHFNSGTTMLNQQQLNYGAASVDFETRPGRWYTLASPLKAVYAGDMYLPKATARQESELFKDITFSKDRYDRFRPAVYQRSWNAAKAMVYELPDADVAQRNVALTTTWSNVYNDVQVPYTPGAGFTVKTDVSDAGAQPEKVKFRLPKADASYKYYSFDGSVSGNEQAVDRADAGRLNNTELDVTLRGNAPNKYFMTGNPFMAYLDLAKFLNENAGLVKQIYVMNGDGTSDIRVNADGTVTETGTNKTGGLLAPMQGFFVVAENSTTSLTLRFNAETMTVARPAVASATPLYGSRSASEADGMTITASSAHTGRPLSAALVTLHGAASADFRVGEDVEMLMDGLNTTPRVYTIAGNNAVTINALNDIDSVEVGLVNTESDVTLTFTDVDAIGSGYSLYDAETGSFTPLSEGLSVTVNGAVAGRLFITSGAADVTDIAAITIDVNNSEVCVNAAADAPLKVHVADTLGRNVVSLTEPSGTATFRLERGIYVVYAEAGKQRLTQKIVIQ